MSRLIKIDIAGLKAAHVKNAFSQSELCVWSHGDKRNLPKWNKGFSCFFYGHIVMFLCPDKLALLEFDIDFESLFFFGHSRRISLFLCLRFLLISKADMTAIISQQQMVLFSYSATTRNEPSTTGRLRFFLLSTRYNKRCLISDETFDLMFFFSPVLLPSFCRVFRRKKL